MNVIVISGSASAADAVVGARLRYSVEEPRIACVTPYTAPDDAFFRMARERLGVLGFDRVEAVDIDEDRDDVQIAYLHEFDVVYLCEGDAVRFRYNAIRAGLAGRLRQCAAAGRVICGDGAGALLLTPNVSLDRLARDSVDDIVASRPRLDAIGAVPYELLPHANRLDESLQEKLHQYSAQVDLDVLAMGDGSALFSTDGGFDHVGTIMRYRHGKIVEYLS